MMVSNSMGVNRLAEPGLPPAPMVGPRDPAHDCDPELLASGPPGPPVENVLPQQRKEGFHGGVVARSADTSHRSGHAMGAQSTDEFPAAELGEFNRSLWTTQPATPPRRATALSSAATARRDFIRESIE